MEALGGSELASLFPPPPRTLLGAVRTAIGDACGVDWNAFEDKPDNPLRQLIGFGDDLGPLGLSGPWLSQGGERLYPVPSFLLAKGEGEAIEFVRLVIGPAVQTHLGQARLPELPKGKQGYKPLERAWLTRAGLEKVLSGAVPDRGDIRHAKALFQEEARLGIARDNRRRITDEGLLYQTRHLRPHSSLAIEAEITLAASTQHPSGLVRLGGEGRLAHLSEGTTPPFLTAPKPAGNTRGLVLTLLTPARFGGWLPPGFKPAKENGRDVWQGQIEGIDLTLHAAVLGKAQREGGWDMANRRPRAAQSLIPAGSAYYLTVASNIEAAIQKLHGARIGEDQPLGRGHIACGLWNANEDCLNTKETL